MTRPQLITYLPSLIRSNGVGGLTSAENVRTFLLALIDSVFDGYETGDAQIAALLADYVKLSTNQTIGGTKTFSAIPKCSVVPSADTDLVNKKYVDDAIATLSGITDLPFDSNRPIKRQVSGLQGVNLGKSTLLTTTEELLYPTVPPTCGISIAQGTIHEYGQTGPRTLSWSVTKTDENITGITVNGSVISPTGNSQSGFVNGTLSANSNTTFGMAVNTATKFSSASVTSFVKSKLRIGGSIKNGTTAILNDADINNLPGYFADNFQFNGTLTLPASNYLIIAVPTRFGNPSFRINGFLVNSFNLVRNSIPFTNSFGYSENFNVWVSETVITGTIILNLS